MNKKLEIPFIKSRGFECGQACAAMIIKYFKPEAEIDFDEFNKIIHHEKGKYTFPPQLAILMDYFGLNVKCFSSDNVNTSTEDYDQFARWFGKDLDYEMKHINLRSFDFMVRKMREKKLFEVRKTSFDQILKTFLGGLAVGFPIDWNTLMGKKGPYQGHFVVLVGIYGNNVLLHDPDIGPFIKYPKEQVEKAYLHPAIANDVLVVYGVK